MRNEKYIRMFVCVILGALALLGMVLLSSTN